MIDLPEAEVIQKIVAQTEHSEADVRKMIQEKLKQLSGLISEDGAAHIIANDLKVQLYKTEGALKITEITTNAKQATVIGKVIQKYEMREFDKNGRKGKVANMLIGDETGRIRVVFWNDQVDLFDKLNIGDIVQIKNPFVKENSGRTELHMNDSAKTEINPAGVTIETPSTPERQERELKYLKDLQGGEENIEVLGTIVQVYDPRFFPVDPETNRRVSDDDVAAGKPHVWNYVTTCFLDDGTANVRTTFWKNQTQHLFGADDATILSWKEDASKIQDPKHELLGEIVKIVGRVNKNEEFGRVELTANLVLKDINPEEELKRLQGATGSTSTNSATETTTSSTESGETPTNTETTTSTATESSTESQNTDTVEAPGTQEDRKVKPEEVAFDSGEQLAIKEDVISIDDLDDL